MSYLPSPSPSPSSSAPFTAPLVSVANTSIPNPNLDLDDFFALNPDSNQGDTPRSPDFLQELLGSGDSDTDFFNMPQL
jgi:hypothetical protein